MKIFLHQILLLAFLYLFFEWNIAAQNPIIKSMYTADPCALVYNNTVYLYTGHDEASLTATDYVMNNWHVFTSQDMVNWTDQGQKLSISNFKWANAAAFAGHVVERNGKFYWYVPMLQKPSAGYGPYFGIGVAVSDNPLGPFTDALGKPLIPDNLTGDLKFDIDPAVFIDEDNQAYLYWGNATDGGLCKMAKLKTNMTEIDGVISTINLPAFTEAPYVHKRNELYYLSYASGWPETISYATSGSPLGPWKSQGTLNGRVSSETNHQSIIEFKGQWYFIYHNADLPYGGNFRRSVCIDYLYYNNDGTIKKIVQTTKGVQPVITATDKPYNAIDEYPLLKTIDPATEVNFEIYDLIGKRIANGNGNKSMILSMLPIGQCCILKINFKSRWFSELINYSDQ